MMGAQAWPTAQMVTEAKAWSRAEAMVSLPSFFPDGLGHAGSMTKAVPGMCLELSRLPTSLTQAPLLQWPCNGQAQILVAHSSEREAEACPRPDSL